MDQEALAGLLKQMLDAQHIQIELLRTIAAHLGAPAHKVGGNAAPVDLQSSEIAMEIAAQRERK
jgi:hypothetical protein